MKLFQTKIIRFKDIASIVFWTIGYGAIEIILTQMGYTDPLVPLSGLVIGFILDFFGAKIVQWLLIHLPLGRKNIIAIIAILVGMLALTDCITMLLADQHLFSALFENAFYTIAFIVITYGGKFALLFYRQKKMQERYQGGQRGIRFEQSEFLKDVERLSQTNQEINGNYDEKLAVQCENGIFVGALTKKVFSFKGIPYAKQPVGERRWMAPEAVAPSQKVYEALYFGKSAPQKDKAYINSFLTQGEDCLSLNIWTDTIYPSVKKANGNLKPVLVYLHGGTFSSGGTSSLFYDAQDLIQAYPEIVVVTVNYRLGFLGMIDFSDVKGGEKYPDAPHLLFLDQIEALKWISKNIAAFGGDPKQITLGGDSSGAISASLFPFFKEAKGLFKQLLILSGAPTYLYNRQDAKAMTQRLMHYFKIDDIADFEALTADDLADFELLQNCPPYPIKGTRLVPNAIFDAYDRGEAHDIPMLLGLTTQESRSFCMLKDEKDALAEIQRTYHVMTQHISDELLEKAGALLGNKKENELNWYHKMVDLLHIEGATLHIAKAQSYANGKSWIFEWNIGSPIERFGAFSGIYIPYLFGTLDKRVYDYAVLSDDTPVKIFQKLIVLFVTQADQTLKIDHDMNMDSVEWPAVTPEHFNALKIDYNGFKVGPMACEAYCEQLKDLTKAVCSL